jgi:glycosyltransferase involved in cell wall biosynthesis
MAISISAVIITFNEERNIERCIGSLQSVADEIIVLDSFSTDKTAEICTRLGVVFIQRKWEGYAASKNFVNQQAKFEYILSLDADEEISEDLRKSLLVLKNSDFTGLGKVNRLTNYCGKWIHHSGWYPDWKIRLFPKDQCQWVGDIVHEELEVPEDIEVIDLNGDLFHYSYVNYEQHRKRADHYSSLTAQKYVNQGKKVGVLSPYLSCLARFFSMYVMKKGFLDGYAGFKIAQISGLSNQFKYKEVRRLNREKIKK